MEFQHSHFIWKIHNIKLEQLQKHSTIQNQHQRNTIYKSENKHYGWWSKVDKSATVTAKAAAALNLPTFLLTLLQLLFLHLLLLLFCCLWNFKLKIIIKIFAVGIKKNRKMPLLLFFFAMGGSCANPVVGQFAASVEENKIHRYTR